MLSGDHAAADIAVSEQARPAASPRSPACPPCPPAVGERQVRRVPMTRLRQRTAERMLEAQLWPLSSPLSARLQAEKGHLTPQGEQIALRGGQKAEGTAEGVDDLLRGLHVAGIEPGEMLPTLAW